MMSTNLNIVYEDNHLLVVIKPVNLPVQGDVSGDQDLITLIKADLKKRYQKPGNVFVGMVHRLDRPVGGIMVFAKTSKAAARLSEQIREREFKKRYYAVVRGIPKQTSGRLTHYLLKDTATNTVKVVADSLPGAKEAILDYQVRETIGGLSLVRVNLLTGRSHQIRVQMATLGTPLYGDQKYGQTKNRPGEQIALWAAGIEFQHPTQREVVKFETLPPGNCDPWQLFNLRQEELKHPASS